MKRLFPSVVILMFFVAAVFSGCGSSDQNKTAVEESGVLQFTANGEDFVRQGFISKDGWDITFDHVYVTLSDIIAYQADPPYDADKGGEVHAKIKMNLPGTHTVDLAEGNEDAAPILVGEVKDAPVGYYNAISWNMVEASEGLAEGYPLAVIGKAVKDDNTINFILKFEKEYEYIGGEYIGEERKGILQADGTADLEMTFHFDHIFGDAETPADDGLNVCALGFEPFAALAEDGTVDVDMAMLKAEFSSEDYQKLLEEVLTTLGHVGEGHTHIEAR